ncbi:MAG: cell wall hydrolase [Roseomonas sp.]|nr:cell wall hydrolase [Roseomonas sp.]
MTKLPAPRRIDIEILAMTLWAEAADKPVRAIEALAALVMNRLRQGRDPNARHIAAICRAPFLFSCWNRRDPRHAALRAIPPGDAALTICRRIAQRAASGLLPDPTGGATLWHDAAHLPAWSVGQASITEIGGLCFYRAEDITAPPPRAARPMHVLAEAV